MFSLESFRPWKPLQDSSLRQEEHLPSHRYPSPVSLGAPPSPSNKNKLGIDSQVPSTSKPERHPLPVRPPIEVCVDGGSQSVDQATRQPESADQTSPVDQNSGNLDFEDIFDSGSLLGSGQIGDIISSSIDDNLEQPINIESCDQTFFCGRDPMPQFMTSASAASSGLGDSTSGQTVDPSTLEAHDFRDCERQHASQIAPASPARAEVYQKSGSPSSEYDASCRGRQQNSPRVIKPSRRSSRVQKVSVVIDNRPKNRIERSTRGPDLYKGSLSTMRAHFSALTAEDRLEFLSWLFESALTHCVPCPREGLSTLPNPDFASSMTKRASPGPCSSRKHQRYSAEEDRLLIQLKGEGFAWREINRRFGEHFPGRNAVSIQTYWSTKLSKQGLSGA